MWVWYTLNPIGAINNKNIMYNSNGILLIMCFPIFASLWVIYELPESMKFIWGGGDDDDGSVPSNDNVDGKKDDGIAMDR